jgi:two-component system C4-dicarboxylate transport response regulator DctD
LDDVLAQCENGGVFFDAIEQMPRDTQLRLLDHMEMGGRMPRIIAGTNMNVADLDQSQTMVPDLYYRLSALSIRIPSLAERPEDIPVMFRHYVAQAAEQSGKPVPEIGPDVIGSLMAREWPGNARSLMSVAMKFVLGISDFVQTDIDETLGLAQQMAQVEKALIMDALRKSNGRVAEAIKILKLPRKTFYDKLNKHGIRAEMFR